jgi:cephalosporin-C deacetylase
MKMPLMFDMPLEQLQKYQGINPRPPDFDSFWDQGIAEMKALDPQTELLAADFQTDFAECSHLYFSGVGGARLHAKLLRPRKVNTPHPAVLMFHGYSSDSGDWSRKLGYVAQGFSVAALDCRGQGGLSEDKGGVMGWTLKGHIIRGLDGPPNNMLFRQIFLDSAQLARIVMDMTNIDENRVGAVGSSQGGALALVCAALEPRIRRVAAISPFLCDYQRVWEIDLAKDAYAELGDYFRKFDPRHEREQEVFEKLGYIDTQYLCRRIKGNVLMSVGLMDTICPPSTQFAAYNKISASKSMDIYPDYAHEELPGCDDRVFQFLAKL